MDRETKHAGKVLEVMEDGIYIVNPDYIVEYMNEAMVRDFGDYTGKKCSQMLNDGEEHCPWCGLEAVFDGNALNREVHIPKKNTIYRLQEIPIQNADGSISKLCFLRDITEKRQQRKELKETEEKYKRLFEHVGCGVYISSKEGKFLDANQALVDMLEYESKEQFLRMDIIDDLYVKPEDRRRFQKMIERDGRVIEYEVQFKRQDGSAIPVLMTSHVRYGDDGKVLGYEGIVVDQTQKKQMERELRESQEDFRRLFEDVDCGVFISSREGRFINANKALLEMLGYEDKDEFLQMDIARDLYVRPEDRRRFQEIIEKEGRVIDYEVEFKSRNGDSISVLLTARPRFDEDGSVIGYEGINVDQTQRKRMEQQLQEAHDFLDKFIQSSPNAIIAADIKGNILLFNRSAEETLGYAADDVIGKIHITQIYPAGLARKIMKMLRSEEYGEKGKLTNFPITHLRQDGGIIDANLSAAIIYDAEGNEIASVGIFVDLSERLEMERQLNNTQQQLMQSEKLAAMGRLTSQIAHELNNPLYGIMNTLELLKTEIAPENKRRKLLDMSLSETVRLADMLRKMLSFSKPDQEERKPLDINTILDEILLLHEKQLQENTIKITTSLAEDLGEVYASANQLRQVFLNIVNNAKDAMPEGGTFGVTTRQENGKILIDLSDTGIGIREEYLDKIFDSFFTTKDSIKGVGLGLSVCYGFIQDHGGDIKVKSVKDEGTTFTVILPVYKQKTS
jgi:two-component system NtrC family sensor kinase